MYQHKSVYVGQESETEWQCVLFNGWELKHQYLTNDLKYEQVTTLSASTQGWANAENQEIVMPAICMAFPPAASEKKLKN
jgi:hypothetical protein